MTEPAMAARRLLEDPPSPRRRVVRIPAAQGRHCGPRDFVAIVLTVLFGPLVHTVDPQWLDMTARNQGRSLAHPFGTDNLGRDTLAQLMAGGRISLAVGFAAMLISLAFGTLVGLLAGYFRALDGLLMRFTDLALALPLLPLLLVAIMLFRDSLRAIAGPELGVFVLIVTVIGITSWMQVARIVRGEVLSVKNREFVLAARSIGARHRQILLRHILPNVSSPILVSATLGIANAILTNRRSAFSDLASVGFSTWGRLLHDGVSFIQVTPARVIWPGLAISLPC